MLLCRPSVPKIETLNDLDCYVANFWRATKLDPESVAAFADGPVNEADLHARHRWLVTSPAAADFRERLRTDPDYFDARVAGWWCWGLCCWIGSGWCAAGAEWNQLPRLNSRDKEGVGVHQELSAKMPRMNGARKGDEYYGGLGVHLDKIPEGRALSQQVPHLAKAGADGQGIHVGPRNGMSQQVPGQIHGALAGFHQGNRGDHRPQLADAYARGRGVHGNDAVGTCEQRRAWLIDWFGRLRDRLRTVRVCCGDWRRVCSSPSVTTRLGMTGLFLDPPYSTEAGRCDTLYGHESGTVAHDVRAYCLERGSDPLMRICLAGYAGEGHEELERHGWEVVAWKAAGGYGNRSAKGKENAGKERLWFSPACLKPGETRNRKDLAGQMQLFSGPPVPVRELEIFPADATGVRHATEEVG
jgi:hypothetical protein